MEIEIENIESLKDISETNLEPIYGPTRVGDVKHSKASIEKIKHLLDYSPTVLFAEGLHKVYDWYKSELAKTVLND